MKKRVNPDSEANIRRIDSKPKAKKQTHGFQVHFLRGTQAVTKMFSDAIHGGKESARRAARKYRKSAIGDLPERIFRGPVSAIVGAASTSKSRAKAASKPTKSAATKRSSTSRGSTKRAAAKKSTKSRR